MVWPEPNQQRAIILKPKQNTKPTTQNKQASKKMVATVQKPAPHFEGQAVVAGGQFKKVALTDFKGKWVVLFFYPLDFTFVCPTEILAFNDSLPEFQKLGAEVVGVSTDSEYSHLAWYVRVCVKYRYRCATMKLMVEDSNDRVNTPRKQGGLGSDLKLTLLADKNMKIATDYGVLIEGAGIALR